MYGPLHTKQAVDQYLAAIEQAKQQGGTVVCGGKVLYCAPAVYLEHLCVMWAVRNTPYEVYLYSLCSLTVSLEKWITSQ